jgi:hypothetical protein
MCLGFVLLVARPGQAQPGNLAFFKNWFVTGGYAVGGVGLRGLGGANGSPAGIATGIIHMGDNPDSTVPPNADILAAFLYWETVININDPDVALTGATFRGHPIDMFAFLVNPQGTSPCWSSGGGTGGAQGAHKTRVYRADVLRFLPVPTQDGAPVGKRLVNDSDLQTYGLPLNEVTLPDAGSGNKVPSTAGVSLVVIYRDPSKPLTSVVIYNGGWNMDNASNGITQTMKGFYQASNVSPVARMTHIVGDGSPSKSDRLLFRVGTGADNEIGQNLFVGAQGPASDPAWDNLTRTVSSYFSGGESQVTTTVDHAGSTFDCLTWGAIIFSTTVQDTDFDGLVDILETGNVANIASLTPAQLCAASGPALIDPNGQTLPDLHAMNANPCVQDIFVEIGYMSTNGYNNPFQGAVTTHNHLPSQAVLAAVAQVFENAGPRRNPANPTQTISGPIKVHFDVGNRYQGASYIIPTSLARGGEEIIETACTGTPATCHFPDYPGTVGWKSGFQMLRRQPLNYATEAACVAAGALCQRRFDDNRLEIFRYALFAHALGVPLATVDDPSTPSFNEATTPKSSSGVADGQNGGGDFMVTLGFWDNFKGTEFVQTSTIVHELGHTMGLRHGGPAPTQANPAPNCKSNYESVMNYLFQVRGLIGSNGPVIDLSKQELGPLTESSLTESALTANPPGAALYPTRWFVPLSSSFLDTLIHTDPATKHCNGTPLTSADNTPMVRVDGTYPIGAIDWDADGVVESGQFSQDINFSGLPYDPANLTGFNDWLNIDLRQTASRRNMRALSLEITFSDQAGGDPFGGDPFGGDPFGGDPFGGDPFGGDPFGGDPFGGDPFGGDPFGGDPFGGDPFGHDLDFATAVSVGNAPNNLTFTTTNQAIILNWAPPHAGTVSQYQIWRVIGAISATNLPAQIGTSLTPTFSDSSSKKNVVYSYFVTATVAAKHSGRSNILFPAVR